MTPDLLTAAVIGIVLVAVALLHALAWGALSLLVRSVQRFTPALRQLQGQVGNNPLTARLTARHPRLYEVFRRRLTPRAFTGLPLSLLIAAAVYLLALLGGLAEDLLTEPGVAAFDKSVNAFFGTFRTKPLLGIFLWITALGAGPAITAAAVIATGFLWAARSLSAIPALWITLLGAEATSWAGKYLVGRARPDFLDVASAASPSFPSGHSTASVAVYGFLAYAVARQLPYLRRRFEVTFWAAILIFSIGFSRIFLSVHYLSDVLSGFLVGGFWLLVGFAISESLKIGDGSARDQRGL